MFVNPAQEQDISFFNTSNVTNTFAVCCEQVPVTMHYVMSCQSVIYMRTFLHTGEIECALNV